VSFRSWQRNTGECHIWARGYCVSTVGLNEEAIREYVRKQQEEEGKEEQRRLWKDNDG